MLAGNAELRDHAQRPSEIADLKGRLQQTSDGTNLEGNPLQASPCDNLKGTVRFWPDSGDFPEDGKNYEKLVTAFVSFEALNRTDDFRLLSNPRKCAPFDDIVLCTQTNNRNVTYLFQVKSKLNPTPIIDDEFKFETFCMDNKKIKSKLHIETLYKRYPKAIGEIDHFIPERFTRSRDIKIVIFTNRPIQENTQLLECVADAKIFSARQGKIYKFKSNFITAKENDADKQSFLESIFIYAAQSDVNVDVTSIIHIKEYFNSEDGIVEAIKSDYFNCVKNWCGIKSEKDILTKEYVYRLFMYSTFKNFATPIDDCDEKLYREYQDVLKEDFFGLLWESIKDKNLNISSEHKNYILGRTLEDFHDFKNEWEKLERKQNGSTGQERITRDFKSSKQESSGEEELCDITITRQWKEYEHIICNDELKRTDKKKQLEYYIGFLLGEIPLIVQDFNLTLKEEPKYLKIVYIESIAACRRDWLQIDEDIRDKINQVTVTTISNQNFQVGDIINGISNEVSISDVLNLIIDSRNKINSENEILIERSLQKIFLDTAIFSDGNHRNDLFIIKINAKKNKFISWIGGDKEDFLRVKDDVEITRYLNQENLDKYKFILTNKESLNFLISKTINVHFLTFTLGHKIQWIKSNGNVNAIKKFRCYKLCKIIQNDIDPISSDGESDPTYTDDDGDEYKDLDNDNNYRNPINCLCCMKLNNIFKYVKNSLIIISGVPGAGKTILLKQFAKTASSNDFILFTALIDHYVYYESYKSVTKSACDHIKYFYKNESNILNDFFAEKIKTKNIIILFDAFDEIAPKYTRTVSEIIQTIREAGYRIILTTRSVLKNKVEEIFGTFAYSLNLFYKKDQKNYLKAYYELNSGNLPKYFIKLVENNMPGDVEFCKVPVNLKLITNVISNDLKNSEYSNISYKLNQLELYERFINYRIAIYSKKIKNTNISETSILTYHKYFSINLLFNKLPMYEDIKDFLDITLDGYFKDLKEGAEKVGILVDDIKEIIMHRTVAEFLAAKWLLEAYNTTDNSKIFKIYKKFAERIINIITFSKKHYDINYDAYINKDGRDYLDSNSYNRNHYNYYDDGDEVSFPVVGLFIDLMINNNELHKSAREGNYKKIKQIIHSNIQNANTVNDFNRTILHTIISKNTSFYDTNTLKVSQLMIDVVKFLITNCNHLLTQRDSFQINIQDYAQRKKVKKSPLLILIHKIGKKRYVYFNRHFELWEIFCPDNLLNCNIAELLDALQVVENNALSTVFEAARGHLDVIRRFYTNGINLDVRSRRKHLVHFAAESGSLEIIKYLFEKGIALKLQNLETRERSIAHFSVISGNVKLSSYLKENNVNFATFDEDGFSAFHYAIIFDKIDVLKYLLRQGFDINFPISMDNDHFIPIQLAAAFCKKDILEFLLENGADINCKTENGHTLLHLCTRTYTYVIKNWSGINIWINSIYESEKRFFDFVTLLLNKGLDINAKTSNSTPLINALSWENEKLFKFLIYNSADINTSTIDYGTTALHVAAYKHNVEILKFLIERNIDINAVDINQNSPLHYAQHAIFGNTKQRYETVVFLIENGVNPNPPNDQGVTPLHLVAGRGFIEELKFIIEHAGVTINAQTKEGDTALHYAVSENRLEIVEHLIESHAAINLLNERNQTPLDVAIAKGHEEIGSFLRSKNGASMGSRETEGPTYIEDLHDSDLHRDLGIPDVASEIRRFATKHESRLHHHTNVEAIELLNNANLTRRLKRKKPFELVL